MLRKELCFKCSFIYITSVRQYKHGYCISHKTDSKIACCANSLCIQDVRIHL